MFLQSIELCSIIIMPPLPNDTFTQEVRVSDAVVVVGVGEGARR